MKLALAVVGLLGVILAVHRYKLAEAEYRRQFAADEANRRHTEALLQRQLEADRFAQEDLIAQRITELSSKASEQLGSNKPAVRIGGLTDLERLAQAYPDLRQTAVDRICAYLRAPYNPPDHINFHPLEQEEHGHHDSSFRFSDGSDLRLELDVRRAAQKILRRHSQWPSEVADCPKAFWSDLYLDLRDATLVEFDLKDCRLESADMRGAVFYGPAIFRKVNISGNVWLINARFKGRTTFKDARFGGVSRFTGARFEQGTDFSRTSFYSMSFFDHTFFECDVDFSQAAFGGSASFKKARFSSKAMFENAAWPSPTAFDDAVFPEGTLPPTGDAGDHIAPSDSKG